ncbi:MAG: WhiB family transcriptional regulator [Propionibacterium sp.]|nr:WhiB family transcriptional regulator [Propionibacterium sp.]
MSTTLRPPATVRAPACAARADLFQHPFLEEGGASTSEDRRRQRTMQREAGLVCAECTLMADCLYRAVVDCDIAGFVAGTTEAQRRAIRERLGIHVTAEDLSSLLGVRDRHHPINRDDVLKTRAAHPDESLRQLANRFGCSVSSIKRHLRGQVSSTPRVPPRPASPRPRLHDVLVAFREVLSDPRTHRRAA